MLRLGSISRNSRTTRSHNKHSNAQCVMGHSSTQSKTCKTTTLQSTLLLMRLELTRIQRKIQTDKQSHQTRHGTKQNRISHSLISAPQPHLLQHSRPHRFAIQHLLCSKRSVCFPVNTLCPKPISFFELCSVVPAVLAARVSQDLGGDADVEELRTQLQEEKYHSDELEKELSRLQAEFEALQSRTAKTQSDTKVPPNLCVFICVRLCACLRLCVRARLSICVCVCVCACLSVCLSVSLHGVCSFAVVSATFLWMPFGICRR